MQFPKSLVEFMRRQFRDLQDAIRDPSSHFYYTLFVFVVFFLSGMMIARIQNALSN